MSDTLEITSFITSRINKIKSDFSSNEIKAIGSEIEGEVTKSLDWSANLANLVRGEFFN